MAAIVLSAGFLLADAIEKKRQKKKDRKARDQARFMELQKETSHRLARSQSGNTVEQAGRVSGESEEVPPPAYHEVVGGRRAGNGVGGGGLR